MAPRKFLFRTISVLLISLFIPLLGNELYETEIINYENRKANNVVEHLADALLSGQKTLIHDREYGYLKAVLKELDIPLSSQTLVFSKTSVHRKSIFPDTPRAIYFNDEVYVGWIPGVKVLEIAVADPDLGGVFYTLEQRERDTIKLQRDDSCLSCHASGRTLNEPGFFIRSVFPDEEGEAISRLGSDTIDHTSDIGDRWGGWYVTGKKTQIHRGNTIYRKDSNRIPQPRQALDTTALKNFFNPDRYLTKSSDVEALMVFEHQVQMHNIFTSRNFQAIKMIESENAINKALGESGRRPLTKKILANATEEILEYMLFSNEAPIQNIVGNNHFQKEFLIGKPMASNGDSLYKLSFKSRISELPCSWLIYSGGFNSLQPDLKKMVLERLKEILTAEEIPDNYIHLRKTRGRIHAVLTETLPAYQAIN